MQSVINASRSVKSICYDDNWLEDRNFNPLLKNDFSNSRSNMRGFREGISNRSLIAKFGAYADLASKIGFVACVLFFGLTAAYGISLSGQWKSARQSAWAIIDQLALKAGLEVTKVQVEGQRHLTDRDITDALGLRGGISVFAFDTDAARNRLKQSGWVREARIMRLLPSTLIVELEEREPFALWAEGGQLAVIDREGRILSLTEPGKFPSLPTISGPGAASQAEAIVTSLQDFPDLKPLIRQTERIGGRRWDLLLDTGLRAKLPVENVTAALKELNEIAQRNPAVLYEIAEIDFRVQSQFILRLKDNSENGRKNFLSWLSTAQKEQGEGL